MSMSKSFILNSTVSQVFVLVEILSGLIMLACAGSAIHFGVFDIKPVLAMRACGLSLLFGMLSLSAGLNESFYLQKAISRGCDLQWRLREAITSKLANYMLLMGLFVALPAAGFCAYYLITSSFELKLAICLLASIGASGVLLVAGYKLTPEN